MTNERPRRELYAPTIQGDLEFNCALVMWQYNEIETLTAQREELAAELTRAVQAHGRTIYKCAALEYALTTLKTELEAQRGEVRSEGIMTQEQFDTIKQSPRQATVTDIEDLCDAYEALRTAAQAVVDRWDTPLWKDAPATATYINALRVALSP